MPISVHLTKLFAPLVIAPLVAIASMAVQAESLSPAQKGAALAKEKCARCHAIGRADNSPMTEAPAFRTFARKWPLESLEEAFAEGIVVGHPAMPEFTFNPEDIGNLLAHMRAISP